MMFPSKHTGFSLIELMVVMGIMAVVMGLTGGLVTKSIDQQQRQVELEQVRQLFKRLSYEAYYKGFPLDVRLQENKIQIHSDAYDKEISFKQLTFVASDYHVSTKAKVTPGRVQVFWNDTIREIELEKMFDDYAPQ